MNLRGKPCTFINKEDGKKLKGIFKGTRKTTKFDEYLKCLTWKAGSKCFR